MPHVAHALTWLRGPKSVASSSTHDRVRVSLETRARRFFERNMFSASEVPYGKPAPDLLLHAAEQNGRTAAATASWSRIRPPASPPPMPPG